MRNLGWFAGRQRVTVTKSQGGERLVVAHSLYMRQLRKIQKRSLRSAYSN